MYIKSLICKTSKCLSPRMEIENDKNEKVKLFLVIHVIQPSQTANLKCLYFSLHTKLSQYFFYFKVISRKTQNSFMFFLGYIMYNTTLFSINSQTD